MPKMKVQTGTQPKYEDVEIGDVVNRILEVLGFDIRSLYRYPVAIKDQIRMLEEGNPSWKNYYEYLDLRINTLSEAVVELKQPKPKTRKK